MGAKLAIPVNLNGDKTSCASEMVAKLAMPVILNGGKTSYASDFKWWQN